MSVERDTDSSPRLTHTGWLKQRRLYHYKTQSSIDKVKKRSDDRSTGKLKYQYTQIASQGIQIIVQVKPLWAKCCWIKQERLMYLKVTSIFHKITNLLTKRLNPESYQLVQRKHIILLLTQRDFPLSLDIWNRNAFYSYRNILSHTLRVLGKPL